MQIAGWALDNDCKNWSLKVFCDSLGRKGIVFLEQHEKQMMPAQLESHPTLRGFYAIYAAFHLFKFCQEEIGGGQDFIVLCFLSSYM